VLALGVSIGETGFCRSRQPASGDRGERADSIRRTRRRFRGGPAHRAVGQVRAFALANRDGE
jgi:hypothetical protein